LNKKRKKLTNKEKQKINNQLVAISKKMNQILEGVDLNNATPLILKISILCFMSKENH
jgi:hypothetical protein